MVPAATQLPCDGGGKCMLCGTEPPEAEKLTCKTCATPWHVECLIARPTSLASTIQWECPDCSDPIPAGDFVCSRSSVASGISGAASELVVAIKAIEADGSLSEIEKAKRRQQLLSGNSRSDEFEKRDDNCILAILGENFKCSFCMQLPDKPVTTPCGHNFCLKCFEKWAREGKKTCAKCRNVIPPGMLLQPRINSALVYAIRTARVPKAASMDAPRVIHFVHKEDLPDKAFTTVNAKKSGLSNAKSGKIFVTIPRDHFGPILAEHDPVKKTGVLVGDSWEDRLACRQWGAHFPHVSGIAGQSSFGAQSVVLSGGYADDEDHGEWFLYTGSGGRDLSGNKRTNKKQSSHQRFTSGNESLCISCRKGYPVRVVRSHKEKRSHYAPQEGVRYDGIYRIEKCWRKIGEDGYLVCRYLFIRCDNNPAPWTSDEQGDRPRALPKVSELKHASDLTVRKESPHWDFDTAESCWKWMKSPPVSKLAGRDEQSTKKSSRRDSRQNIMKEFGCLICHKVMSLPVTTPCAHNFCKPCLDAQFAGQAYIRERNKSGRQLRTQKNVMKCPCCSSDIADFIQNAQINTEMMGAIESMKRQWEEDDKATEISIEVREDDEPDEEDSSDEDVDGDGTEVISSVPLEADKNPAASKQSELNEMMNERGEKNYANAEGNVECVPLAKKRGRKRKAECLNVTDKAGPASAN